MASFDKLAKIYDSFLFQLYSSSVGRAVTDILRGSLENNERVLDIGCGTGNFVCTLKTKNKKLEIIGLDESEEMISRAKKKCENSQFIVGQAEKLPFETDYFDVVFILGSLHYFLDQKAAISECRRVLKSGGHLVITTPQCDNHLQRFRLNIIERNMFRLWPGNVKKNCSFLAFEDFLLMGKENKLFLVKTVVKKYEGVKTRFVVFEKC